MTKARFSRLFWKGFLLVLVGVAGLYVLNFGFHLYRLVCVEIPHSYAGWATGDLLVEYLDTHDGKWPQSWSELRTARDSLVQKGGNIYYDFERLPGIVKIDWNAKPDLLTKAVLAGDKVKVVTQVDGSKLEARWGEDTEPNQKIARYLIKGYSTSNTNTLLQK